MDALAPVAVAVPLAAALLLLAVSAVAPRWVADGLATIAAAATAVICVVLMNRSGNRLIVHWFGGWRPRNGVAIGVAFAVDQVGATVAALAAVLATVAFVVSWRIFDAVRTLFHVLVLLFLGAMVGFAFSGDLFNLFVFFELMGVTAYALTGYKTKEQGALQGGINFAVSNSIGGFCVLMGIALLYAHTGALSLAQIGTSLTREAAATPGGHVPGLVVVSLTLLVAGFLVKAAAVPFHFWLADAHAAAPTPACILFSGVMVELGLYAVARVYWVAFSGAIVPSAALRNVVIGIGVLTAVVGACMALMEHHIKRLLAFSTISHSGVILIGIGLLDAKALAGDSLYVIGHGLVKASLFVCAGILAHRFGAIDDARLFGRGRHLRFTAVLWTVGGLALAGLPPFGTELGKGLLEESAHEQHRVWLIGVYILASAFTGAAVLRAGAHVFAGWGRVEQDESGEAEGDEDEPETTSDHGRTPMVMVMAASALLVLALAVGLGPGAARRADDAARRFVDRDGYTTEVLRGTPAPAPPPEGPAPGPTTSSAILGMVAALGSVAIAGLALALENRRDERQAASTSDGSRRSGSPSGTGMGAVPALFTRALRSVHSGHVGDDVAWLTFGVGVLGALFVVAVR